MVATGSPLSAQRLPRIEGGVVDALHEPVRAAEVWAWAGDRVVARTRTDGEGAFALANLPPAHPRCLDDADPRAVTDEHGRYEIANVAIGEVTVRAWGAGFDLAEARIDGTEEPAVDFALQPATTTITFALGQATPEQLAAATFVLRAELEGAPVALPLPLERGRPDASGEWRLAGWPNHVDVRYARVDLPGSRAVPWRHEVVRAKDGLRVEFEALAPEAAQLRGVLRGPDGAPLGGKELLLRPFDDHPGSMRVVRGTTASDGAFALPCPVAPRRAGSGSARRCGSKATATRTSRSSCVEAERTSAVSRRGRGAAPARARSRRARRARARRPARTPRHRAARGRWAAAAAAT